MRDRIVRYADPEPRYGLLARDGATRIAVIPRPSPVAAPPQTAKP